MRRKASFHQNLLIFSLCFLLAGCASVTTKQVTDQVSNTAHAHQFLQRSKLEQFPLKEQLQLQAAELFIKDKNAEKARKIINALAETELPIHLQNAKHLVSAHLNLLENSPQKTLYALSQIQQTDILSNETKIDLLRSRAQALSHMNYYFEASQTLMDLDPLLESEAQQLENRQQIWYLLNKCNTQQLRYQLTQHKGLVAGWITLAQILKSSDEMPNHFVNDINIWRAQNTNHPANVLFSEQLETLEEADKQESPKKIALLLPISGKLRLSAEAIQNGVINRLFNYIEKGKHQQVSITVYDTESDKHVLESYRNAIQDGTDFIIGPLTKQGVNKLSKYYTPDVSILTLNRIPSSELSNYFINQENFYQMGLLPEDEISQIIKQAKTAGYKNAVVIASDSRWGTRISKSFATQWEALAETTVQVEQYKKSSLDTTVQKALLIDESKQRIAKLRQIIPSKFETQIRRREDVDVIFLAAGPTEAKQIMPLLSFYFAKDIPVYATASVYDGTPKQSQNKDLNGTIICDSPWALEANSPSKEQAVMQELWPDKLNYVRLQALGGDALDIAFSLKKLVHFPSLVFEGATGDLQLDENQHFARTLPCAKFSHGHLKLLNNALLS